MLLIQALTARLTAIAQVVLAKVSSRCTLPLGQGIWMETSKSPRTRSSMCCTRAAELDSSKRQLGGTRPSGLRSVPCTFLPRRNHHSNRCSRKMRSKFISSLGLKAHLQSTLSTRNHHVDFSCRSSRRGANCCTLQRHISSLKLTVVTITTSSLSCASAALCSLQCLRRTGRAPSCYGQVVLITRSGRLSSQCPRRPSGQLSALGWCTACQPSCTTRVSSDLVRFLLSRCRVHGVIAVDCCCRAAPAHIFRCRDGPGRRCTSRCRQSLP
mmetsp:Transcript_77313/g.217001  ORF Transcript_77313/g.217001 Transcript_77313/m.217001 type:complete len:269 (-) Transcript_77313:517-1323(-)